VAGTPDTDVRANVMGFLRRTARNRAVPKTQVAIEANLKSNGVCHVPSTAPLPCWIDGEHFKPANAIISFSNGNLDVEALIDHADDDMVWRKPTPLLFTTTGRSYPFDSTAKCPRWQALLDEMLPDPELQSLLHARIGGHADRHEVRGCHKGQKAGRTGAPATGISG